MALKQFVFILIFVLALFCEAMHVHPKREELLDPMEERVIGLNNDAGAKETENVEVVPKNLSPSHSILFFKSYDPCEDGFKLDWQGVCREVWF